MEQVGWFWRYRADKTREKNSKWWFSADEVNRPDDNVDIIKAYADPQELQEVKTRGTA